MSAKGGLVCPPVYYDIPAKENAFMDTGVRLNMPLVNMPLALRQWTDPVNLLQMFGLSILDGHHQVSLGYGFYGKWRMGAR